MYTIGETEAEYVMTATNGAYAMFGGKNASIDFFVMAVSANKSVNVFLNNDGHALMVVGCRGVYCCMVRVHPP